MTRLSRKSLNHTHTLAHTRRHTQTSKKASTKCARTQRRLLFVSATQLANAPTRHYVATHMLYGGGRGVPHAYPDRHKHRERKRKEELRNHNTQYSHFIRHFAVTTPITLAAPPVGERRRAGRRAGTTIAKPNDVVVIAEGVTPKRQAKKKKKTREKWQST